MGSFASTLSIFSVAKRGDERMTDRQTELAALINIRSDRYENKIAKQAYRTCSGWQFPKIQLHSYKIVTQY